MLFTDASFLLFLAVLFVAYYLLPKKTQWPLLLAASWFFYALSGFGGFCFILITTATSYLTARGMAAVHLSRNERFEALRSELDKPGRDAFKKVSKRRQRLLMWGCLVLNLGILAVVKYSYTAVSGINSLLAMFGGSAQLPVLNVLIPLGISYYTFQSMGYIIDVGRGSQQAEKNFFKYALFVSFFPQLIQGPISRFSQLSKSLFTPRSFDAENLRAGALRMLLGYFKKVVIADRLLIAVKAMTADDALHTGWMYLVLMLFYTVTLFCDFSGGIDIAIGVARVLGIELAENFDRPFRAKSVNEFWRRWHITLSTWFRDYVYYPITVSPAMLRVSKRLSQKFSSRFLKMIHMHLATLFVWFLTGLWHGATPNFIVWGLLNGGIIVVSLAFEPLYKKFQLRAPGLKASGLYGFCEMARTFILLSAVRTLDLFPEVGRAFRGMASIFTQFRAGGRPLGALLDLGLGGADYLLLAAACAVLVLIGLCGGTGSLTAWLRKKPVGWTYTLVVAGVLTILIFGAYGVGYDSSQFIYNQF